MKENNYEPSGGYYYNLFKFFSDTHGLILVDSEIQDIISAVERFKEDEHYEAHVQAAAELDNDGSGIDYDNLCEDDEDDFIDDTCPACGFSNGEHLAHCPEDHSPFAELIRNGYD